MGQFSYKRIVLFLFVSFFLTNGIYAQKSILITAPKGYSERFGNVFSQSKLVPILTPMIETVIPAELPQVKELISNFTEYDYIVFSSRKAIESFYNNLDESPAIRESIKKAKFCAIGKDIEYLRLKLGIEPAIYPDEPSPRGIGLKLAEDKNINGKKIAVLVPKVEQITEPDVVPHFLKQLDEIGLIVTRIDAYITKPVAQSYIKGAVNLICENKIDCIAFTSSAEIETLLLNPDNKKCLDNTLIACFGPYTAAYARKKGLNVQLMAKDFNSFEGFLHAIEEHLK